MPPPLLSFLRQPLGVTLGALPEAGSLWSRRSFPPSPLLPTRTRPLPPPTQAAILHQGLRVSFLDPGSSPGSVTGTPSQPSFTHQVKMGYREALSIKCLPSSVGTMEVPLKVPVSGTFTTLTSCPCPCPALLLPQLFCSLGLLQCSGPPMPVKVQGWGQGHTC